MKQNDGFKDVESVIDKLYIACYNLEEATPNIRRHKTNEEIKKAVYLCTDYLSQILVYFPEIKEEFHLMPNYYWK